MPKMRQPIPEGLAEMPPGPGLAAVLAGIDLSRLGGLDCVEVMRAQHRQASHEQARQMVAMVEVALCGIGPDDELPRMEAPDEWSADEIRAALSWTRSAADTQLSLAWDLTRRIPAVFAALDHGHIDVPKTKIFSEWTTGLSDEQARQICDELLPDAPTLTTGHLGERIKRLAIAIDPDWARKRYEEAVRERKIVGYRNADGTGNLCGYQLPADQVAAASAHMGELARKVKRAGDGRPIDHIRADLFLGMTEGTFTGYTETDIIGHMLAVARQDTDDGHHVADADAARGNDAGVGRHDDQSGPGQGQRAGVEIRTELTTLLGMDDHPAEIAGWGMCTPTSPASWYTTRPRPSGDMPSPTTAAICFSKASPADAHTVTRPARMHPAAAASSNCRSDCPTCGVWRLGPPGSAPGPA
jgi:hypothetical protein